MFRKRIKALYIASVLVCILPIVSYSMDKDEFLKFLVNSSYPEIKEDNKEEIKNTLDKKEKDYIKFHVGEENIPQINKSSTDVNDPTKKNEETSINTSAYKNDIRVTKENPKMLLYHSHAGETYSNSPEGNYHSKDIANSIVSVGMLLAEELNEKDWGVIHSTKYHDYPDFNNSYMSSRKTLDEILPKYESVDIAIDVHRDGRTLIDKSTNKVMTDVLKKEHERASTVYKGESVAKFLFVVGQRNENVNEVTALAEDITKFAQKKYPELIMPVVKKPYGKFNQSVAKNHMLIEIGSNGTTVEEAKATVKYIAEILDEYFKQNK
ncbi:MAG: stage II sporulation protein P [Romboutsia sp.]